MTDIVDPARVGILLDLAAELAERMDVADIAGYVIDVGVGAIGATAGSLCVMVSDAEFEVVGQRGYPASAIDEWRRFPSDAPVPAADAVTARAALYLRSGDEIAERYPLFASVAYGEGATAVLPMIVRDRAVGVVTFTFDGEREFADEERAFLESLVRHCAAAIDRAQVHAAALRRQDHLALIADSSSILAARGDDLVEALRAVARRVVPVLADMCAVFLVDSGTGRLVAWAANDPDAHTTATGLGDEYRLDAAKSHRLKPAIQTNTIVLWEDAQSFADHIGAPDSLRAAMLDLGIGPGTLVPLVARGRAVGLLALANRAGRAPQADETVLAQTLGQRMAVLIDNARLLAQRTEISQGLQAALLPPTLPQISGLEIAARYRAAGDGLDVGGDFYDVLALDADRWLFVIGDVTGHGVRAAAVTGLLRHTIAGAARLGTSLEEILVHANSVLGSRQPDSGTFATVALIALDRREWALDVACAGHPPPLLKRVGGQVQEVCANGRILGFFEHLDVEVDRTQLEPGDIVLAYTDGVTERHDDTSWFGPAELQDLISTCTARTADDLASTVAHAVVEGFAEPPADDIAVLVLRRTD